MIEEFYEDLKVYEIKSLGFDAENNKNEVEKSPSKSWNKQVTSKHTINPIESIDEEKKEPNKPSLSKEELDKEKARIEKEIESEKTFMLNLFLMSREEGLTNDPNELYL